MYSLPSERPRAAFIVPKRYGKAVLRNQQKRRMREAYRQHQNWFPKDRDLLFYMRPARPKGRRKGPLPVQRVAVWGEILQDLQHLGAGREKARH